MNEEQGVEAHQKTHKNSPGELKGKERIKRKHLQHHALSSKNVGY